MVAAQQNPVSLDGTCRGRIQSMGSTDTVSRIAILRLLRAAFISCLCSLVHAKLDAQVTPATLAISGELLATPLSRAAAQRVGALLQRAHPGYRVVTADSIAALQDGLMYSPRTPSSPADLREVYRQFNAAAIVDIMMFHERQEYRGIAFRTVLLRSPSRTFAIETALLPVGQAIASTADSVALQLVDQVVESLRYPPKERALVARGAIRCLDFSESEVASQHPTRVPSNTGCC